MKKIFRIAFTLLFLIISKADAQNTAVHIVTTNFHKAITVFDPGVNYDPQKFISAVHLDENGKGLYLTDVSRSRYIVLHFADIKYVLFLSKGDNLLFKADFTTSSPTVVVSGKGSNNNQHEIFSLTHIDLKKFKYDEQPDRAIAAIKFQEARNVNVLKRYIKLYKPTNTFIKNVYWNNRYFALSMYYEFYHRKYSPYRTMPYQEKWQRLEDSLIHKHKLCNDVALTAYNYEHLIENFFEHQLPLLRIKEQKLHPVTFYKYLYNSTPDLGKKILTKESTNVFSERVITKYFNGKSAELEYAQMFRYCFRFNDFEDLPQIFHRFKNKYPDSKYLPIFSSSVTGIIAKQNQVMNEKMIFMPDNGTKLNTINDVISLMKGKTVFVDMWGTWCGPCRIELEKYTPQIRAHFKNKNIVFLYIACKDLRNKESWKKAIAYYKVEGMHILANDNLDKDIMTKVRSTGYPTHFIIKKDGSFKKTKIQDELHTQGLIKEIETEI